MYAAENSLEQGGRQRPTAEVITHVYTVACTHPHSCASTHLHREEERGRERWREEILFKRDLLFLLSAARREDRRQS